MAMRHKDQMPEDVKLIYSKCLEDFAKNLQPSRVNYQLVVSVVYPYMQMECDYYRCLEYFNVPYEAFEIGEFGIHYESRFNPLVSNRAKSVPVIGEEGNYFLEKCQLQEMVYASPETMRQVVEEALNPFKDYPDLTDL